MTWAWIAQDHDNPEVNLFCAGHYADWWPVPLALDSASSRRHRADAASKPVFCLTQVLPAIHRLKIQLKQACQIKSLRIVLLLALRIEIKKKHPRNSKLQATMWTCQHTRDSTSHSGGISTIVAPGAAATWPRPVLPTSLWSHRVMPLVLLFFLLLGPSQLQTQTLRRQSVQKRKIAYVIQVNLHSQKPCLMYLISDKNMCHKLLANYIFTSHSITMRVMKP